MNSWGFFLFSLSLKCFIFSTIRRVFFFLIPKRSSSSSSSNENETGFEERTHTAEGLPSLLLASLMAVPPLLHRSLLKHHLPESLPCSNLSRRACEACQNGGWAAFPWKAIHHLVWYRTPLYPSKPCLLCPSCDAFPDSPRQSVAVLVSS